jgi:hypothetical protein
MVVILVVGGDSLPPVKQFEWITGWVAEEDLRPAALVLLGLLQSPAPPTAPPARRALPTRARRTRRGVLHARRVERGSPASLVILSQLQVVALAVHPDCDVPDASPRVQPGAEGARSHGEALIRASGSNGKIKSAIALWTGASE